MPLNLGILTYDVIALIRPVAQARGLPLEHRLSCEPDVPDTLVGDPERIAQVLTILLDNAIKFSTSGVVRLSTSVSTDGPESARVVFAVSDEGVGIPEESHDKSVRGLQSARRLDDARAQLAPASGWQSAQTS